MEELEIKPILSTPGWSYESTKLYDICRLRKEQHKNIEEVGECIFLHKIKKADKPCIEVAFQVPNGEPVALRIQSMRIVSNSRTQEVYVDGHYELTVKGTPYDKKETQMIYMTEYEWKEVDKWCEKMHFKFFSFDSKSLENEEKKLGIYSIALYYTDFRILREYNMTKDTPKMQELMEHLNINPLSTNNLAPKEALMHYISATSMTKQVDVNYVNNRDLHPLEVKLDRFMKQSEEKLMQLERIISFIMDRQDKLEKDLKVAL